MSDSASENRNLWTSGGLWEISITQRPAFRLNQLTVSLVEIVSPCPALSSAKLDGGWFL